MRVATDTSEYQTALTGAYFRDAVVLRAAFGTWKMDDRFLASTAAAKAAWDAGHLRGGVVLYQPVLTDVTAQQTFDFLWKLIGPKVPDWLTGVLLDVESWPGTSYEIRGDHSQLFNTLYGLNAHRMGSWLGCKAYANWYDMQALWSRRDPRCEWIEANYGPSIPARPGKVGQQYTDGSGRWAVPRGLPSSTPPFGPCDHNAFPGVASAAEFRALWGRPSWALCHEQAPPKPSGGGKPPADKPSPKPYYNAARGNTLVTPDGARALVFRNGGRLDVMHNGALEATVNMPKETP